MAMFLAEISFLLALGLFAAGLTLWHRGREGSAGLLRGAGAVLVVGSVLKPLGVKISTRARLCRHPSGEPVPESTKWKPSSFPKSD